MRRVDSRFPPNRAINLRQKRRRYLHKPHTTAQDRSGKPDQITDNTPTKSDDDISALDLLIQQPFAGALQLRPALCRLTCGQGKRL